MKEATTAYTFTGKPDVIAIEARDIAGLIFNAGPVALNLGDRLYILNPTETLAACAVRDAGAKIPVTVYTVPVGPRVVLEASPTENREGGPEPPEPVRKTFHTYNDLVFHTLNGECGSYRDYSSDDVLNLKDHLNKAGIILCAKGSRYCGRPGSLQASKAAIDALRLLGGEGFDDLLEILLEAYNGTPDSFRGA